MTSLVEERRTRRSTDPITALHYQLAHARSSAGLSAMVLVDTAGALVAGAGAWPVCEELAAYAPLIARRGAEGSPDPSTRSSADEAVSALREEVTLRAMEIDSVAILLAARGAIGPGTDAGLVRAAAGCLRILGVEA